MTGTITTDPRLDLSLHRIMAAAPESIWRAWTEPRLLEQWWVPAPSRARVERLDPRPGGSFVTSILDDGAEPLPHIDGIFLVVEPRRRLVFTNAITSAWRPTTPQPVAMTAEITFDAHPDGTDYRVVVRHGDPDARDAHERMGFFDGWGTVTAALATLVEKGTAGESQAGAAHTAV